MIHFSLEAKLTFFLTCQSWFVKSDRKDVNLDWLPQRIGSDASSLLSKCRWKVGQKSVILSFLLFLIDLWCFTMDFCYQTLTTLWRVWSKILKVLFSKIDDHQRKSLPQRVRNNTHSFVLHQLYRPYSPEIFKKNGLLYFCAFPLLELRLAYIFVVF